MNALWILDSPILDVFDTIHEEISCLTFSADGRYLIAGFAEGWVQIWQWPEMYVRIKLRSFSKIQSSCSFVGLREDPVYKSLKDLDVTKESTPSLLVLTSARGTAELWDFEKGTLIQELPRYGKAGFEADRFYDDFRGGAIRSLSIFEGSQKTDARNDGNDSQKELFASMGDLQSRSHPSKTRDFKLSPFK